MPATTTKPRPLILRPWEVAATLAGRKTMLRRPIDPQPETYVGESGIQFEWPGWHGSLGAEKFARECPLGWVGDRHWVKERLERHEGVAWYYSADGHEVRVGESDRTEMATWCHHKTAETCQAGHMPRWASRLTVENLAIRVERVQSITEADAKAEGADLRIRHSDDHWSGWGCGGNVPEPIPQGYNYRDGFRYVWEMTYGLDSWSANDWVWVVEYKAVEGE